MRCLVTVSFSFACVVAQDPTPPPGGFAVTVSTHAVTWSDGYLSRMDLYVPNAAAPTTGWPGVLAVHGGDGQRSIGYIAELAQHLAQNGYVVYAYDVRGNVTTTALNPGVPPDRSRMLTDSAESHALANTFSGGVVDQARLAVTGFSQGGVHSYEAAAWSGKPIPPTYATTYPPIRAAFAWGHTPARVASTVPGDALCSAKFASEALAGDPTLWGFIQAGDYPGLANALRADPQTHYWPEFATSSVPLFTYIQYHDAKQHPNPIVDALQNLAPGTPWGLALGSDGHATPENRVEQDKKLDLRLRWFDHHVKGLPNGVDLAPRVDAALFPANASDYQSPSSRWRHCYADQWPPPSMPQRTLFLRAGAALSQAAPSAVETGPVVTNAPATVAADLPLDVAAFATTPFGNPLELIGRPTARLWLDATAGDFQVTVALYRLGSGNAELFVSFGTAAVRGGAPGRQPVDVELMDVATRLEVGDRLQLRVENLALFETPNAARIRWVPEFSTYDLTVVMEPGFESRLSLPARVAEPALTPAIRTAPLGAGLTHQLETTSSPQRAGQPFVTVLGVSGAFPGTAVPGAVLPVNWDVFSDLGLTLTGVPNPWLTGFAGALDAQGRALHTLTLDPAVGALFVG
ncbi:MAG: hypothetical protein KAI24_10330, partial [Planctomycetes bacterium]|nr:hypothetical protein [Planctomycetota bacterium]